MTPSTVRPAQFLTIVAALLGMIWLALHAGQPTAPAGLDAAPSAFSAARAMPDLKRIAARPHPIGSEENEAVRDYLVAQLKQLGWQAQVQEAQGLFTMRSNPSVGNVHNIVARKAGSALDHVQRKALLLVAHYDSVPHGPGAGDDGAGVAAILETLRALRHGAPLQNDLIVLLTDGEEAGLLGAEAFVAQHPWVKDVGLVLNFEFRGNSGPVVMFETSVGNGRLIDALASAVPHPVANSLNYEVYKLLPNDTDMSVFKRKGLAGLNFAGIEGHTVYHTALDTPEHMDQASLQHEGDTMLALVHHFGNQALSELAGDDQIYFDFPGLGLVHYASGLALPLTAACALLVLAVCALAVRSGVRWRQLGGGALLFLLTMGLLAGGAQLVWMGVLRLHPYYQSMLHGTTYNSHWYMVALVALALAAFCALAVRLQKRMPAEALALGSMLVWLALLVAASVRLPGASFVLLWPLLAMALALGVCLWRPAMTIWQRNLILLAGAAPGVILMAPLLRGVYIGLTPNLGWVMVLLLAQLLGLLAALLVPLARPLQWLALLAGLACLGQGAMTSSFDREHPRQTNLFYMQDGRSGKALWLSPDAVLNDWTRHFFPGQTAPAPQPGIFGNDGPPFWSAAAPDLALSLPQISVIADRLEGGVRKLDVDIKSLREAPMMVVTVEGTSVLRSSINTRTLTRAPSASWALSARAIGPDGMRLALELVPGKPFLLRVRERSFGLPPQLAPQRPADMIAAPFGAADSLQSMQVVDFK